MSNGCVDNSLNSFYRGKVLLHLSNGFCKIYVPGVNPPEYETLPDFLPAAELASPLFSGALSGNGMFSYPSVSSTVWVFFANGDQNYPVYFASTLGGSETSCQWDNVRPMAGEAVDDAYIHKIHTKNSDITLYETGQISLHTQNALMSCDLNLDSCGNIMLSSSSKIVLLANEITISANTQLDIGSPTTLAVANTVFNIESPAISLDSSTGHTVIKSISNGTTTF